MPLCFGTWAVVAGHVAWLTGTVGSNTRPLPSPRTGQHSRSRGQIRLQRAKGFAAQAGRKRRRAAAGPLSGIGSGLLARWIADSPCPAFDFRRRKIETDHEDLYLVRTDGTAPLRLTNTRWVAETHPSWDPSGQRIAFNSFRISRDPIERIFDELLPFGNSIVQINFDGSCSRTVLGRQRSTALYGAAWQPGPGREAGRIVC